MGQSFSKLMAQHNENEMVLKELKLIDDQSKVYKLVGPVLLSQVGAAHSLAPGHAPSARRTRPSVLLLSAGDPPCLRLQR